MMKPQPTRATPNSSLTTTEVMMRVEPRLIEHQGRAYAMMQAQGMFIAAVGVDDRPEYLEGCPALILHHDRIDGVEVGIALIYPMDVATMRAVGKSLIQRAREFEGAAAEASRAALRKAAGK